MIKRQITSAISFSLLSSPLNLGGSAGFLPCGLDLWALFLVSMKMGSTAWRTQAGAGLGLLSVALFPAPGFNGIY